MTKFQMEMKKLAEDDRVANFHHAEKIAFSAIPNSVVRSLRNKLAIHTSRNFCSSGRSVKGSEYFLAEIEGRVAYVRISDHWGKFDSRDKVTGEWKWHTWELVGDGTRKLDGSYKSTKMAGYVFLD